MGGALIKGRDEVGRTGIRAWVSRLRLPVACWILLVFSCGTVLSAVLQRHLLEGPQRSQNLVEFNIGEMFGVAAIVSLILAGAQTLVIFTRADLVVLVCSALAWFVPEQHGVYIALTLAGGWFAISRRSDKLMSSIAQIWIALSVHELWGKLIFKVAYQSVAAVEVGLLYRIGRLFYGGLDMDGATLSIRSDWSIVVLEGCSSFHNLSLTVLIWLSILKIAERPASPAALRALVVSASLIIAINIARILVMLPSREAYLFWHDGTGSTFVALTSVLAAILPILYCLESRTCRPPKSA